MGKFYDLWSESESLDKNIKTNKNILMHILIMNPPSEMKVDHIYHEKFDNRKNKLRLVTNQQNSCNCKVSKNNTSGVTGVWFNKKSKKWCAEIKFNYKKVYLGTFVNKEDAVKIRKETEIIYFGEYRNINN